MTPGLIDSGEGKVTNGPYILPAQSSCGFVISHSKDFFEGFLKRLDEVHLAWGTILNMDMKNVGILKRRSTDLQKLSKPWAELLLICLIFSENLLAKKKKIVGFCLRSYKNLRFTHLRRKSQE